MAEVSPDKRQPFARRLLIRAANVAELLALLSLISVAAGYFGRFNFLLDLASHFRLQAISTLLIAAAFLWIVGRRSRATVAFLVASLLAASLSPFFWPSRLAGTPTYRLMTMNVLTSNTNRSLVIDYILESDCDFVLLQETDAIWVKELDAALSERWPHSLAIPRYDNFGIAIYSQHDWLQCTPLLFDDETKTPSLAADFELNDDRLRLIVTHAVPPMNRRLWQGRNQLFDQLAQEVATSGSDRTIVAGDLNCTPWSPWFRALTKQSGLSNSSRGHGLGISWVPFDWKILGLPIDHVLVGDEIRVHDRIVGPNLDSDHRPMIIEFE